MKNLSNKNLTQLSKTLRKNMTREERKLWYGFLKNLPITINRQKVIGNYIVDFYCASARVAIELDGAQHYTEAGIEADRNRTDYLREQGITVLRYSNRDVNQNFSGVCMDILKKILPEEQES